MKSTPVYMDDKTKELLKVYVSLTGGSLSGTIESIVKQHILKQPFIQSYITNQIEDTQNA